MPASFDDNTPPVMAELWRGDWVESRHRGHAVVADASGQILEAWGDPWLSVYPRSAVKSLQAIPLVESGALDAFGLGSEDLALACASHSGEPCHVERLGHWLSRMGLEPSALMCGAHPPFDEDAAAALIRAGMPATAIHNNCSGKHLGLLTTILHHREPLAGYHHPDHPAQRRVAAILEAMTGVACAQAPMAVDGCGVPTWAMPLAALATAMARFAAPVIPASLGADPSLVSARLAALLRVREAWSRHPVLIGGRTSFDTGVMEGAPGAVLVKSGGEGIAVAVLMERELGIALKIEDGTPRGKNVALAALLRRFGVAVSDALAVPVLTNWSGRPVGVLRPAPGWLENKA